ncbi:hypothetical protein RUND412_004231 [Rhizina undulata]
MYLSLSSLCSFSVLIGSAKLLPVLLRLYLRNQIVFVRGFSIVDTGVHSVLLIHGSFNDCKAVCKSKALNLVKGHLVASELHADCWELDRELDSQEALRWMALLYMRRPGEERERAKQRIGSDPYRSPTGGKQVNLRGL